MQFRRFLCMVFSCLIAVSCFGFSAKAVEAEVYEVCSGMERASGRFSVDIPGNTLAVTSSDFPLEIGETIAINASYSPRSASVRFWPVLHQMVFFILLVRKMVDLIKQLKWIKEELIHLP